MTNPMRLATWACICVLIQLPERTYTNPYGYYGAYSRTRRDPAARNPAYSSMVQPNPIPMIPNAMGPRGMGNYGGHQGNQPLGMDGSYGQDGNVYGVNQYGAVDNSFRKSLMGRMDATSQHGSLPVAGGAPSHTDLNGYQSQSRYASQQADQRPSSSPAPDRCSGVKCQDLNNCLQVTVNDTQCCPKCVKHRCICEGYQVYDCQQNGFKDGMVPEGQSYLVAGNTTVCSCPPGGGSITCSFHDSKSSKCPELPASCVKPFVRDRDGCDDCAMVGCKAEDGTLVEEGMTMDKPPCSTCYCPPGGGKLICGVDPACEAKLGQQGQGTLAMESSIREINSLGRSNEANAYGGYAGYGAYPDYGNQFGQSNTGSAPVVPPVSPIGTRNGASAADTASKGSTSEGQRAVGESNGYNSYGSYQQGYNMGNQNQYSQYGSLGQGNLGYGGNNPGYGSYGYNQQYAQTGAGYPQQAGIKSDSQAAAPSADGSKTANGMGSQQNTDSYGYPMGGYDPYRQQPYVPPLVNGNQGAGVSDSKQTSSSFGASSESSDADTPSKNSQAGASSQAAGYPYNGYGQGGYYQPNYYGQYQGYNQFQPQVPVGNGADTTVRGSEELPKTPDTGEEASDDPPNQVGSQTQQGYTGTSDQYPYGPYGGYGSYYGSQYAYPHQQMPAGAGHKNGLQAAGQGSVDPNTLSHDGARSHQQPSDASQGVAQTVQDESGPPNREYSQQSNYPYYPYDQQQQLYPTHPSQRGSQYDPVNPLIMQPGAAAQGVEQPPSVGNPEPRAISREDQQPTHVEPTGSRRIRDNLNVINKGRFSHEKPPRHPTPATTTSRPTTTTKTTTKPTTTSRTTARTTTTTTTPPPTTTTTTTRPTKATKTDRKQVSLESVLTGCCSRGRQWAEHHNSCDGISVMPGTYSHICSVAQEKCCLEAIHQSNCQQGMIVARSLSTCDVPADLANTCGASEFKMCCDCCEMGLKAVGLGMTCDMNIFGQQCNKAYTECCKSVMVEMPRKTDPLLTTTEATVTSPETPETSGPRCSTHSRCQQICDDTQDGMVCSCERGYRLHSNRRDCADVNECVLNTHTCTEHQICLNREGSFFCQRKVGCGTGYELTETNACKDIDECELNIHDCLPNTDCENLRGSYRCIPKLCDKGFITDATGRCIDIDECRTREYSCPRESSCVNTEGSYVCRCPIGLTSSADNTVCEDIDECVAGSAECKVGSTCINTIGSFVCQGPPKLRCAPGYEADEDTRTCKDIDECSTNTHTCKSGSTCINEHGGFRCQDPLVCPQGMEPDEEGRVCLDVNECDDPSLHRCNVGGRCVNLASTFKCVCDTGHENAVTETGLPTCKDVDECASELGDSCLYDCRNLPGKYECYCPSGYTTGEDGKTCQDIDECAQAESPCADGETCFNTHGTYKCVDLACPAGYTRTANTRKSRRCSRQSCRGKPRSCLKQPKQISFHNISLSNDTRREKPLFRMSLARSNVNDRYEFLITDGNSNGAFKVKSSTTISRPTGVVYTAQELIGPKDYVIDLSLKLNRGRRHSTFISRLYIFVGEYDM